MLWYKFLLNKVDFHMPKSKDKKLTPKQQKFVDEYLIDLNATQAAIRAGYSAKTAEWIGPQLLGKSHVAAAIKARRDELSRKTEVTQERIILEMSRLAFMDIRSLFNPDGSLIPIKQLSDSAAAAIAGIDVVQIGNSDVGVGHVMKYKLPDKNKALENLARILGYFDKDKNKDHDASTALVEALVSLANRLPN
ncbi:MAG: terminase small subunit [Nitrosomonas sp.]|nr:terminase small subunit [Nitrosomonas sp.]